MAVGRPRLDQKREHCREEGMDCRECIRGNAMILARLTPDMSGALARQLFQSLYPEPQCAGMSGAFVQIVLGERKPVRSTRKFEPVVEFQPVEKVVEFAAAAVA